MLDYERICRPLIESNVRVWWIFLARVSLAMRMRILPFPNSSGGIAEHEWGENEHFGCAFPFRFSVLSCRFGKVL